jgi:ferredoxin
MNIKIAAGIDFGWGTTMKVKIDREGCISCTACWTTCPDFFEENPDDGRSQVVAAYRIEDKPGEGNALKDMEECIQSAAEGCPVQVIHPE